MEAMLKAGHQVAHLDPIPIISAKRPSMAEYRKSAIYETKSSVIKSRRGNKNTLNRVGKCSREIDTALPGKHTRALYDTFKRREASELTQLRTIMTRLNKSI
jgi:hypothetical protein